MESILEVSGVRKRFPGVVALAHADLVVRPGEVHAVVGENGAGKSTLVNVISGAVHPDEGQMRYRGAGYAPKSPQDAYRAGVRVVFQHLSLVPNLTVTENLFLGRELAGRLGFIDHRGMVARASRLLEDLGFADVPATASVASLSISQKYLVEVAKALLERPHLVILDEPTVALNATETELLFELTQTLRDEGRGVIWITHRLEELSRITDRVTIMRDGRYVETRQTDSVEHDELIRLMTGRQITATTMPDAGVVGSTRRLEVEDLQTAGALHGLSLQIEEGEILGIGGLAGSGVEEVGPALFGLRPVIDGRLNILGRAFSPRQLNPRRLSRQGLFYLPGDRQLEGLIPVRPVAENATVSSLDSLSWMGFLKRFRERRAVARYIERLRVRTTSQSQPVRLLSGGNQQKLLFARGMMTEPRIFILEEPTQGVDVGSKADIYAVIQELAAKGSAVLVISTDTRELLMLCHRILVLSRGRVTREFSYGEADEESLVTAYFGKDIEREAV